jgi:hypothetical protein
VRATIRLTNHERPWKPTKTVIEMVLNNPGRLVSNQVFHPNSGLLEFTGDPRAKRLLQAGQNFDRIGCGDGGCKLFGAGRGDTNANGKKTGWWGTQRLCLPRERARLQLDGPWAIEMWNVVEDHIQMEWSENLLTIRKEHFIARRE